MTTQDIRRMIIVRTDPETHRAVRIEAAREEISMSQLVEEWIKAALKRQKEHVQ